MQDGVGEQDLINRRPEPGPLHSAHDGPWRFRGARPAQSRSRGTGHERNPKLPFDYSGRQEQGLEGAHQYRRFAEADRGRFQLGKLSNISSPPQINSRRATPGTAMNVRMRFTAPSVF